MQTHFEFRHHAEISAAAAQRPKQIGILAPVGVHDRSIGRHQRKSFDVVARKPKHARQPAGSAAKHQSARARMRDNARGEDQPRLLRHRVHGSEQRASRESRAPRRRIHRCARMPRQINHQAAIATAEASQAMTAATHRGQDACAAADFTAICTSATSAHRAINPGRRSTIAFQILRASPYSASSGRSRSPLNFPRSAAKTSLVGVLIECLPGDPGRGGILRWWLAISIANGQVQILLENAEYRAHIVERVIQMKRNAQSVHTIRRHDWLAASFFTIASESFICSTTSGPRVSEGVLVLIFSCRAPSSKACARLATCAAIFSAPTLSSKPIAAGIAYTLGTGGEPISKRRADVAGSKCFTSKANGFCWPNQPVIVGVSVLISSGRTYMKRDARRRQQIFQRAGDIKIQIQCLHVDRPRSAILIIVKHHQRAAIMRNFRHRAGIGAKAVHEAHVRERHDQRLGIEALS